MKKLALWTAGGLGLATVCGIAGLAHLSATVVTLTVFCTLPGLLSIALDALPNIWKARE
ncbi:hypothetical protein AB3G45_22450 [Shinella sp. S4-D37]|uniref:hypothetical protein n=1 Tax=Shinella sp. S4-D37 TaxID=3161999 RepID=UPI003465C37A